MKRVLFFTVVLCLLTAGLFASGSSASTASSANEVTLTMINRVNTDVIIENNAMLRYIREKYGFNIQLEAPPINNYNERIQIIMASADLPDIVYLWGLDQNYIQWAEQGLFNAVDNLVTSYPNIMHNVTPDYFDVGRVPSDGKVYTVPRPSAVGYWGYECNVAWLKKLGISAPTTLDEYYEFGKLVRDNDPDGNGQADTYLLSPDGTVGGSSYYAFITEAFMPQTGAPDFDGVYKVRERLSGYLPYLDYMRKLYTEGIMDPEYVVNKTYGGHEKMLANRVATNGSHLSHIHEYEFENSNGAFDWIDVFPNLKNTDGIARNYVAPPTWGGFCLPASSNKTRDALRFLDWGNSLEGFEILWCGVPGLTYNSYDFATRSLDQTPEQKSLWTSVTASYMTIASAYDGVVAYISSNPVTVAHFNQSLANYHNVVTTVNIKPVSNPDMNRFNSDNPDLVTRRDELENLYVTGLATRAELENFINSQWLPRIATAEATYVKMMTQR